jgi:hypothetical protein
VTASSNATQQDFSNIERRSSSFAAMGSLSVDNGTSGAPKSVVELPSRRSTMLKDDALSGVSNPSSVD